MRVTQLTAYALVLVLAVELATWEAFLSASRPFGTALPVAAVIAGVGNLALGRVAGWLVPASWGAVVPGLLWLVVVLPLAVTKTEGDLVVVGGVRGWSLLVVGSMAIVIAAALPRATPSGPARR